MKKILKVVISLIIFRVTHNKVAKIKNKRQREELYLHR